MTQTLEKPAFSPGSNLSKITDQIRDEIKRQEWPERKAGIDAMARACGTEIVPVPVDLKQAAALITQLKTERDAAKDIAARAAANEVAGVALDLQGKIAALQAELAKAHEEHDQFVAGVQASLLEFGMKSIPGIQGYFSAWSPALSAAEGAAILTHHCIPKPSGIPADRAACEAYLTDRGWKMMGSGKLSTGQDVSTWKHEDGTTLTLDAAVIHQVKADAAPFTKLAKEIPPRHEQLAKKTTQKIVDRPMHPAAIAVPPLPNPNLNTMKATGSYWQNQQNQAAEVQMVAGPKDINAPAGAIQAPAVQQGAAGPRGFIP